jgi:PAS domain S-box-containing protein
MHKRKGAEVELSAAKPEWEDIFQAIGHPSFILGPDHRIIACNKAVAELTGKSTEHFIGRKCYEVFHMKDKPPHTCPMEKLLHSSHFETVEMEMEAMGRTFLVSCTPVFDESGVLNRIIHIATDITESKRAEQKLRKERDRAQTYLDIAAVIFVAIDATGKVTLINRKGCEILGRDESQIIGKNWFDSFVPEGIRDNVKAVFAQLMAGKIEPVEYFENPVLRRDGRERIIAWNNTLLRDEAGNITGTLSSGEDVTERKHAEEKLHDNQKQLKALASELSLAEERERRRIALGIHDDLGQKLAMAKFRLETLRGSVSDRNMRAALDNECVIMNDILDDVRSLTFELSNPLLYEVGFESAIKSWLKTEIQKNAGLKCEFTSDDIKIELDEDIKVVLFKAVRELLINIVKHAGARTVKVGIAKRDNEVEVTVEDDGAGFDVSKLGLPSGRKGGFGLFSIKERLEYIGGRLEIESSPLKGTRVVMTAPVKKSEREREEAKLYESTDSR